MKKIKVIYIVGAGHSGSTLLGTLISTSPKVISVGEFSFYGIYKKKLDHPKIQKATGYKCSCGKELDSCKFWSKYREIKTIVKKRYSFIENIKFCLYGLGFFRNKLKKFLNYNSDDKIFNSIIADHKGVQYILDSSKDPRRLIELSLNPKINLKVIHLIRDGRAYVYSYRKKARLKIGLKRVGILKSVLKWIFINLFVKLFLLSKKFDFLSVTYKEMCENTENLIDEINNNFDINIPGDTYIKQMNTEHYQISCNYKTSENLESIKFKEAWKNNMSFFEKLLSNSVLRVLNSILLK